MSKLKTLKDFENSEEKWLGYDFVLTHVLREEAIKWVKERNIHHHQNCDAKITLLKFFNITEEDLK